MDDIYLTDWFDPPCEGRIYSDVESLQTKNVLWWVQRQLVDTESIEQVQFNDTSEYQFDGVNYTVTVNITQFKWPDYTERNHS